MVAQKNATYAEESAEVEVLLASLTKTKDLTKRIRSSVTRLDESGKVVKDAIGPIYSNTQSLQVMTRNIDRINEAIEKLRKPLDSKGREEDIIRQGPKTAGLQNYLGALKRVDKALSELSSTNIRSNQQAISEFQSLLSQGVDQLFNLYRREIEDDSAKVEPLHYVTKELDFPTFSQEKSQKLGGVASAIVSASAQFNRLGRRDDDPAVRIYSEIRGDYLDQSLSNSALATISTSKKSPNDTSIYRQGTNGIGTYARALEDMFLAEHTNVTRVFRGEVADRVFNETCSKALKRYSKTLMDLNAIIKGRIMTDCFLAYEILDLTTPMPYRLEQRTGQLRNQLSDAVRPIRDTARSSVLEILALTRSQAESLQILPVDGNTIPLVHDTATRLRTLAQFDKPLSSLLASIGDNGWRKDPSTLASSAPSATLNLNEPSSSNNFLPVYLNDILDTLLATLSTKSQAIHRANRPVAGIFMLNTLAVLNRAINSSPELSNYVTPSPNNAKLEAHRKPALSSYLNAWRDPSSHLLDTIVTSASASSRPISGQPIDSTSIIKSLGSKDKDKIKDKFRNFNTSFDDCVARHKSMFMEPEVKTAVARDVQGMIEPLYARFWDRYHEVDKGKGKVVKYSKGDLATIMAAL